MKRTLVATAVSAAVAIPAVTQAVDFAVSGHINRMIRFADDGQESDIQFVDNSASRSRVRFVGQSDIGNGMKAGVRLELGFASNRSGIGPGIKGADGGDSFGGTGNDIRHSALWFGGSWGTAWLGHTSSAADGAGESDSSGTFIADSVTSTFVCGSCELRTSDGGSTGLTIAQTHGTFDGGRLDVLRYDSPSFGPAGGGMVSVSAGNKGQVDLGAFYQADAGPGTLAASGGYTFANDRRGYNQWQISGSYLLHQGANLTLFYEDRDRETGPGASTYGAKVGYRFGKDALSVSYQKYDDTGGLNDDGDRIGVGWVRKFRSVEVYGAWQKFGTDISNLDVEDFNTVLFGSRVKFE